MRRWTTLRQRADFLKLQTTGQKWVTPAFVIQLLANPDSAEPVSIGFTATKKLGGAVIRNRCKRRLRAMCDEAVDNFEIKGIQMVIIARQEALTRDFVQLTKDLNWALRKLGMVKTNDQQTA